MALDPGVRHVDNLVMGGGEAGKYIAWHLAAEGQSVAVIERQLIGGSCPNIACLPSKNVIRSAKIANLVSRAASFGIRTDGAVTEMRGVRQRKRDMVAGMVDIHAKRFAAPEIDFVLGEGRFTAPRSIEVRLAEHGGVLRFTAERVFLNLGTRASVPHVPGLASAGALTHVEALELDHLPGHLIILGGGYVGVEFAQAYRRFGSHVTIVHNGNQLLRREDPDVAEAVQEIFAQDGIDVLLDAQATAVDGRSGDRISVRLQTPSGERTIEGTDLLIATGRTPNTHDIGLDIAGIDVDSRGFVTVDNQLRTSATDVWAMGECAGSPQFTHVAFDDFRVVRDQLAGKERTTEDRLVPYCAFIDPELGRVGLSERDAERLGGDLLVFRLPMTKVLRARAMVETIGFMKAIVDAHSNRILGFTMLGIGAGEVIAVVQTPMLGGMSYTVLRDAIFTHPTMAEGLNVLLSTVPERIGS